jgi:hypothetical protein
MFSWRQLVKWRLASSNTVNEEELHRASFLFKPGSIDQNGDPDQAELRSIRG